MSTPKQLPEIGWYAIGTTAALGVSVGVFAPAFVAYGIKTVSFIEISAVFYVYFALGALALAGVLLRQSLWMLVSGALATVGALLALQLTFRMARDAPGKAIEMELSWGHFVLAPSAAMLILLALATPAPRNDSVEVNAPTV